MPPAVQDEIALAYGMNTPVLIFVEEGVKLSGFNNNFGTHLMFDRKNLYNHQFLEKAIRALHDLRIIVQDLPDVAAVHGMTECYAEYVNHLVELKHVGEDFTWQYSTSRKLVFTHSSKRGFPTTAWALVPPLSTASLDSLPNLEKKFTVDSSTRNIKIVTQVDHQSPERYEAIIRFDPPPEAGDFVEYTSSITSRRLNPVWLDERPQERLFHLANGEFACADGLVIIYKVKKFVIEFRFDAKYELQRKDLHPFVAAYTSSIDYEVDSELARMEIREEKFGGALVLRMVVESPLPGHLYGVAWNPKQRPA
ncbi:MAG: hypothetical protein JWO26_1787 [Rhodospirillales bacterium]|nr:hypothetical protein [Rhodospirillales bacterium]